MNTVFLIWPCEITTVIQISNLYLGYNLSFYDIWWGKFDLKTNKSTIIDPSKIHTLVGHSTFAKTWPPCLRQPKGDCKRLLLQWKIKILTKHYFYSEFCIHPNFTAQYVVVRNWNRHVYIETATFLPSWLQLFNLNQVQILELCCASFAI